MTAGRYIQWTVWLVGPESHTETLKKTQKLGPHRPVSSTKAEVGMAATDNGRRVSRKQQYFGPLPWEREPGQPHSFPEWSPLFTLNRNPQGCCSG